MIDTEAAEELRVTVVATGLGEALLPSVVVDNTYEGDDTEDGEGGRPDYDDLDRPTVMRKKRRASGAREVPSEQSENMNADYLDIPAFLRRQAD